LLPKGIPNLIASKGTHITGTVFPLACIAGAQTALIIGKISKENLFQAIHTYRPGMVFGFPTFLLLLVNDPTAQQYDFSSVEVAMTGGVLSMQFTLMTEKIKLLLLLPRPQLYQGWNWLLRNCRI